MRDATKLLAGAAVTLAMAELYHGPLGGAVALEQGLERAARAELDRNEMVQVQARLAERPMRRTLILSGPADDFQRRELVEALGLLPGIAAVEWDAASLPAEGAAR